VPCDKASLRILELWDPKNFWFAEFIEMPRGWCSGTFLSYASLPPNYSSLTVVISFIINLNVKKKGI
jgi:hypothetical protein